ncbi:MAG: tRNA pseudouridine(13) synthase TruD [Planctomycetes bacterium]|nr:tRNA pseudouridine(13) synthase TruD [Planctomycetota bacterium]
MLVKLVPEDFIVEELTDWQPAERGSISVYEVTKRKLDTFEAIRVLAARAGVGLPKVAYVGLKDRQGVTTQLISIEGGRLDGRIPGIRYRYLGRAKKPLGPEHLRGNAFTIVVRDLGEDEVALLRERRARLARHGLVNYFDDQRFGSLVAGQGLPGRDLVRGDHEAVVRALIATPGKRDPLPEKKFKVLVTKAWGDWELLCKKWGTRKGAAMIQHLRRRPGDFAGALQRLPAKERAIHVFAYQSLVWNRSVALYLGRRLPARALSRTRYVGGDLVWPDAPADQDLPALVETFPLLDHTVEPADPDVRAAVDAALAEEGLTRERFRIEGIAGCFFKHHERPLRVWPEGLDVRPAEPDDRRPGRLKVRLSFRLPPGAYATLVLLRLFGAQARDAERPPRRRPARTTEDAEEEQAATGGEGARPTKPARDRRPKKKKPRRR